MEPRTIIIQYARYGKITCMGFLLFLIPGFCTAQGTIDSLMQVSKRKLSPVQRAGLYSEIGTYYTFIDLDSSLYYYNESIKLAKATELDSILADTYVRIARPLIYAGIYDKALQYLYDALALANDDEVLKIRVLINIGTVHYRKYDFERALENYNTAETSIDANQEILGSNYYSYLASLMNNIGIIYDNTGKYDSALVFYSRGLIASQQSNDSSSMGNLYANIGKVYQYQKKYDLAKSNFLEALLIRKKINERYGVARAHGHLGSLFIAMEMYDSARNHLEKSVRIANDIGSPETEGYTALLLADVYAKLGDFERAYTIQTKYKALMDSLSSVTDSKRITQIEMQYEFDKKEREEAIARKNKEFWTISIMVFLILVLILVILLFILQRIRANNEQLQKERFSLANRNLILEKNALKENLEYKNKQLTTNVMYLMKKNELINDVSKRLLEIKKSSKTDEKAKIHKIVIELNTATNDDVWEDFELRFNEVYNDFYERLIGQFPNLTPNDRKLCAFLRLNLSSKEICAITRQTPNSLNVSRARLRKKLGIDNSDTALVAFLEQI